MKVLYISTQRSAAEQAASALRSVGPNLAVVWAGNLADARRWIENHRNFGALIVEVESDDLSCAVFVRQVRSAGVTAPVVVVSVADPAPPMVALRVVADQVVSKSRSFLNDLPFVVSRALHSGRPATRESVFADLSAADLGSRPAPLEDKPTLVTFRSNRPDVPGAPRPQAEAAAEPAAAPSAPPAAKPEPAAAPSTSNTPVPSSGPGVARPEARGARGWIETELVKEITRRKTLEQDLADALLAARRAEELRVSAEALAEDLRRRDGSAGGRLAELETGREALSAELAATREALDRAREQAAGQAQQLGALTARLDEQQTRAAAGQVEATAALETLQARLADRTAALRRIEEQGALDRQALAVELAAAESLREDAAARHAEELDALNARFQEYQRHTDARLAEAGETVASVEAAAAERLLALRRAHEQADTERQRSLLDAAERQRELEAELGAETARRRALEAGLAQQIDARRTAEAQAARLAEVEAQFAAYRAEAAARQAEAARSIAALETTMAERHAELAGLEEQAAGDRRLAAAEAIERQNEFDTALAREADRRSSLEAALADAEAARRQIEQRHAEDVTSLNGRLADVQTRLGAQLAEATAALSILQAKVADRDATLGRTVEQALVERERAAAEAVERRREFTEALGREAARRQQLETALAEQDVARQDEGRQRAAEIATLEASLAEHHRQAQAELAQAIAERRAAEARAADALREAEARADARLQSEREQAEATRRALEDQAAADRDEAAAARRAIEERAAHDRHEAAAALEAAEEEAARDRHEAAAALQAAGERAARELHEAGERAARRQTELAADLREELGRRQAVEAELADTRLQAEQAQGRFLDQVADLARRAREQEARFEERAAAERAEWTATLARQQQRMAEIQEEYDRARQYLAASQDDLQELSSARAAERAAAGEVRAALETQLSEARASLAEVQAVLNDTRHAAEATRVHEARTRADERARFEAALADRDRQLREQAAAHQGAAAAAAEALAAAENRLRTVLAAHADGQRGLADLERQRASLAGDLESVRRERDTLRAEAARVPQLAARVEDLQALQRRLFDESPVSLCRCRPDGVITQVNRSMAALLGYRNTAELEQVDFAAVVFESGAELPWIVERRLASGSTESVETTWRRKDRRRILVRLQVVARTPDGLDLAAEDITTVRSLEERLRTAQRMEAVARYASEVAATCERQLRDVSQEGQEWIAALASDASRYHGELLLDEVSRAAALLGQLSVYGQKQQHAAALVEVGAVLRDLGPVLKRVAGDQIDLVLPPASAPLHVDMEAEQLERILVNVAAYGRGRMRSNGRLMIEAAAVTPDQRFVEKYPNVRPGPHVLLTVTEVRRSPRTDLHEAPEPAVERSTPGVDLGTLQELINGCGGHLWMTADPPGDMVLKIHLPRRALDDLEPRTSRSFGRPRWIERLAGVRH